MNLAWFTSAVSSQAYWVGSLVTLRFVRMAWRRHSSTFVRCIVASWAPAFAFQEYGLSFTQSRAIAVTWVSAALSPLLAAVMPWPIQRSECNHMYQLGL